MLTLGFHVGLQNSHAVDGFVREGAFCGNALAENFHAGKMGQDLHSVKQQLPPAQICGDHGEDFADYRSHFSDAGTPQGICQCVDDFSLAAGAAEVTVNIQTADSGINQCLGTV